MKNLLASCLLLVTTLLSLNQTILAQSSSEELETQKRLIEVESKRVASSSTVSAKTLPEQISYVEGLINYVGSPTILLSTSNGSKIVTTNDSTRFINLDSKGKKLIGFGDLKIGETIQVIGLSRDNSSGVAKLIIRDQNPKPRFFSLFGKNKELKDSNLTLESLTRNPVTNSIVLDQNTRVKSATKNLTQEELKIGAILVATGNIDDKNNLKTVELLIID